MYLPLRSILASLLAAGLAACGESTAPASTNIVAIIPVPGSSAVSPSTPLSLSFSQAMPPGVENHVDLHEGRIDGVAIPMGCGWSGGGTTLTCLPAQPLASGTRYALHVGGGMRDVEGRPVTIDGWTGHGGNRMDGGMMAGGGMHAGDSLEMMPGGWPHGGADNGMAFEFTTAP